MKVWRSTIVAALLLTFGAQVQAGIIVGGTRLVYDGGKKEASLGINNPDKVPYLIQSWVDTNEGDTSKAPFIITPPLFRLDGEQNNILRVVRAGGNLPTDKESLYWLNIKSIPSAKKQENSLQIAVKTRIKLIYRPQGLPGTLEDAAKTLTWQRSGNAVQVTNASPYFITLFSVKVNGSPLKSVSMVAPKSSARFELPEGSSGGALSWEVINDYGGITKPFIGNL
ncbi:TPA: fimbrial biogenesis chaperone [Serratia fonticola]|uniref:fimbrial biogenesis chaperone n=1 Tax=Serratia TaxID=613 RepID=UPI000EF45199|nr:MULTISPECIES: molecular chaperone [Serratia]AYM91754.1 molecular chaperone [Serratia sp. 3ACOL1]MBL5826503.1 molecular chaperone [Serratia fonticola]MBL5861788.1 molecular chaperone [Serratia fonticola]MBL5903313.1 molecular chaperone [Serratia fonticola]CAI1641281.1 Chaperone protein focC precursor [Serratia fonticola]